MPEELHMLVLCLQSAIVNRVLLQTIDVNVSIATEFHFAAITGHCGEFRLDDGAKQVGCDAFFVDVTDCVVAVNDELVDGFQIAASGLGVHLSHVGVSGLDVMCYIIPEVSI